MTISNSIDRSFSPLSNENRSPSLTKISSEQVKPENQPEIFDDDTSKLTFKEKMILFNKKKNHGLNTSSTLKSSRSRLTQVFYPHRYILLKHVTNTLQHVCRRYE